MADFVQLVIYGVVLGSILTLGAIGLSLIYGILRFAHFAHGGLMAVGAYLAYAGVLAGLPLWAAALVAVPATAGVAIAIDQVLYRHMRRRSPVILLIASFGVSLILRSLIQIIWGPDNHVYSSGIQIPWRIGDLRVSPDHVWIVGGAVALVVALHLFLTRTKVGKALRAMADDMDLALVSGIPAGRMIAWMWGLAGGLAGVAGIFLAMDTRLNPMLGWHVLLPSFAAAMLGGIGRPYGAILGGMIMGLAMELSTLVIDPAYKPAVAFVILVALLIFRPQGILGGRR